MHPALRGLLRRLLSDRIDYDRLARVVEGVEAVVRDLAG